MIIAGTGHRPDKLGGYSPSLHPMLVEFARQQLCNIVGDTQREQVTVISGMALGWDLALAEAAAREGFKLECFFPCLEHYAHWPQKTQVWYTRLLTGLICNGATGRYVSRLPYAADKGCMERRNRAMVDDCQIVLALWNGSVGGTGNCIAYANKVDRTWVNLWLDWEIFADSQLKLVA